MLRTAPAPVLESSYRLKYISNAEYEFQYTRLLLTALGIWPKIFTNATRVEKIFAFLIFGIFILTLTLSVIPFVLFTSIKVKTMNDRLVFLGPLGFHLTNSVKYIFMMRHADAMKKCLSHMKNDWMRAITAEEQRVMLKSANLGRSLTRLCALFMYSGGVFFQAMAVFKPKEIDEFNVTIRQHVLPRYDYFVDAQISPVFEITYATHVLCIIFLYTIEITACNLAAVFVGHICGQVQVMKVKLNKLQQFEKFGSPKRLDNPIASIIHCHVNLLKSVGNIRTVLREICLVEVMYSSVVMCWLEFFCLKEWSNGQGLSVATYFTLFVSLTFNIFILCYIGERLKNECQSVADLTYMTDWCQIPRKKLSSFILIIAMARYPRNITAGGLVDLTLQSFGDVTFLQVLKTSLAYLQMLRTVTTTAR
ncbi:uncharacterized protein LOC135171008 isoform X2 [Diachasmimorpha longicaudata]|uniref:uncharacterized protein LOC135171008 isoform X2 n=1 Tax=Diachasmimorpha longicaudata TaxID=58733 RepID=UPI0030B8E1EB